MKNVLRRISCLYPGLIQLPVRKTYTISENLEWYISRQFKALNIVDYQNELQNDESKKYVKINSRYGAKQGGINCLAIKNDVDLVALMEASNYRDQPFNNAKKLMYNSFYSELIIVQYHENVEDEHLPIKIDEKLYISSFDKIIKYYILSSADFLVPPPDTSAHPKYYELFDLYFDNDVPKNEMREILMQKKDSFADNAQFKFAFEEFAENTIRTVEVDIEKTDNEIKLMFEQDLDKQDQFISMMTKAKREVFVHKNYKYALLECFTFIELFVTQYLTEYKLSAGISKKKLKTHDSTLTINYKLNIELPIFLRITEDEKKVIDQANRIRDIRNKIVHSKSDETVVSKNDALEAIDAAYKMYELINSRK